MNVIFIIVYCYMLYWFMLDCYVIFTYVILLCHIYICYTEICYTNILSYVIMTYVIMIYVISIYVTLIYILWINVTMTMECRRSWYICSLSTNNNEQSLFSSFPLLVPCVHCNLLFCKWNTVNCSFTLCLL